MDAGPILLTRWTSIKPEETAGELHDRLARIGVDAVRAALDLYRHGFLKANLRTTRRPARRQS
jgi:methionyl-tRNA formyltransferase